MAGVAGNLWTLGVGKQTVKGTANAVSTYKMKATGGGINPSRGTVVLSETDASRQQGASVVVESHVEGSPSHYLRPSSFGLISQAALGTLATSGAGADKTHTATPSNSPTYYTLIKAISTTLVDQYKDCVCTGLSISGSAGGVITHTPSWYGLSATFGSADAAVAVETEAPLVYPQVTVTRGGAATGTVESFTVDIANNGGAQQGDGSISPYDYAWGKLDVSGTMTLLFENDQDYRRFFTGTTVGTQFTTTLTAQTLTIACVESAIRGMDIVMAGMVVNSYGLDPDPGGAPYKAAIGFYSQPQTAIADYIKLVTRNQVAAY